MSEYLTKIIADRGYKGEEALVSTPNDIDSLEVMKFKDRVMSRHESFNSLIKNFDCLTTKWRHGVENHGHAFKACCVIVHYELNLGLKSLLDPYP